MTFTKNDFLTIEVLQRLDNEMTAAANRRGITILPLDLAAGEALVPTADFINTIEENLARLGASDVRVWHGEDKDEVWLNFEDVNRWFTTLQR